MTDNAPFAPEPHSPVQPAQPPHAAPPVQPPHAAQPAHTPAPAIPPGTYTPHLAHPAQPPQLPAPDPRAPLPGLPFGSSYRTPHTRWWKGALSIVVVIAAVLLFSLIVTVGALILDTALGMQDPDALLTGQISVTPAMLAATNLSLIMAAALSLVAHRFINGVRVGFFHSVAPGLRWGWMWLAFGIVAPVYLLFALSSLFDPAFRTFTVSGTTIAFFAIILLTTPLQAAAEEYMFRGVIQRSVGSWFRSTRWAFIAGTAVSAVLFSAAHFAADIWLIIYYLLFGILLSILTQRTGGLEAAIAIHTANNLFLLLLSALTDQMDAGFDRSAGVAGPIMLVPVVILAVVLTGLVWVGKRRRLAVTTPETDSPAEALTPAEAPTRPDTGFPPPPHLGGPTPPPHLGGNPSTPADASPSRPAGASPSMPAGASPSMPAGASPSTPASPTTSGGPATHWTDTGQRAGE